jgi:DNA polymerase-4
MVNRKPVVKDIPFKVEITLFNLSEAKTATPTLFPSKRSSSALDAALDKLNARYSKQTIYFGGAHEALGSAPMRIAFNHIPDPDIEGEG